MSLEATIQENTNAIRELIAAFQACSTTAAVHVAAVGEQAAPEDKLKTSTGKKQPPAAAEAPAPSPGSTSTSEASAAPFDSGASPGEPVTYQAAADAVTKLARTKGREAAVAVLTKFGAAKLPDVKPEQFADIIAAAEKAGA